MKPDPTIEECIAALEKENGDLKAASARAALVDSVAKTVGVASICIRIYEVSLTAQLSGTIVYVQNGPVAQRWSRGLIILWFSVRIRVGPPSKLEPSRNA